jgi:hypothetical protein
MSKAPKFSPVMVRLTLEERAALEQSAKEQDRSLSQMARLMLIKSLPTATGFQSAQTAMQPHSTSVAAG